MTECPHGYGIKQGPCPTCEARLAIDRALGQGHLIQPTGRQLEDAATAVVNRLLPNIMPRSWPR